MVLAFQFISINTLYSANNLTNSSSSIETNILNNNSSKISQNLNYEPFTRYIDIKNLRLFALEDVSESFIEKVAEVYESILIENKYIDETLRVQYFKTLKENYIYQKIGLEGPEYYEKKYNVNNFNEAIDCCPRKGPFQHNQTDYIWEYKNQSNGQISQINEVVEHLLHTITNVVFTLQFQNWDWKDPSSDLNLAMQEAIDKGVYNISSYKDILNSGNREDYQKITTTEFAYWIIIVEWGYGKLFNLPNDEFKIHNSDQISETLPLSHKLYQSTVKKILNPPDINHLKSIF